jgi:hypothetical protein
VNPTTAVSACQVGVGQIARLHVVVRAPWLRTAPPGGLLTQTPAVPLAQPRQQATASNGTGTTTFTSPRLSQGLVPMHRLTVWPSGVNWWMGHGELQSCLSVTDSPCCSCCEAVAQYSLKEQCATPALPTRLLHMLRTPVCLIRPAWHQ